MLRRIKPHTAERHIKPLFDWKDESIERYINEPMMPVDLAAQDTARLMIITACDVWLEQPGAKVVHTQLGIVRLFSRYAGLGSEWRASLQTSPIGAVLHGTKAHLDWLLDAAAMLRVDESWMAGLLHGFDRIGAEVLGKRRERLRASLVYMHGVETGRGLAGKYILDC